jgi:hypothetical protein
VVRDLWSDGTGTLLEAVNRPLFFFFSAPHRRPNMNAFANARIPAGLCALKNLFRIWRR